MTDIHNIVIVGGGHGGGNAAIFLRQYGFEGAITLVSDEPLAPYHRPPLSKAWLKGEADGTSLLLKPQEWYPAQNVQLRLGARVARIDREAKHVELTDGSILPYDALILATGARARRLPLPGADLPGVLELRNAADAEALKQALSGTGRKIAVVGGGYVGLEVAASARALGAEVVVVEREARVLARVACAELSNFFQDYHRGRGVVFELNAGVEGFDRLPGGGIGIRLADGRTLACDVALVGVGAVPNDELAREAGLDLRDGVVVDAYARTGDPAIFAVGDVTRRHLLHYDREHRLESVPNAVEQAKQAAATIIGRPLPPVEVPWFWSDQYDLKLQIVGLPFTSDRIVVRGSIEDAKFALFHLHGRKIQAVEAVNSPPEFMAGKMLIAQGKEVDPDKLVDLSIPMKSFLAA
ncbi:NAD(P)/FAD-dependent oxidoreductase [Zavarzinia sp. CC-PAN008]|uniref:NAD(P)/FAD-dependent oxidoreductase n=1 Tax=Zavarzinia sp. CC-PAN008 TaxID=3243332 RepID=UPI003F7457B0